MRQGWQERFIRLAQVKAPHSPNDPVVPVGALALETVDWERPTNIEVTLIDKFHSHLSLNAMFEEQRNGKFIL